MGLFSTIGTALGGPVGGGIGAAADIGLGFLSAGKENKAIEEARRIEEEQIGANLAGFDEAKGRLFERTQPAIGAGQAGTSELQRLLIGGGRQEPTQAERFATEDAFRGVDRASAAGKRLFSGRRIEDFATTAADVGSRFRQQGIQNLFGLSGQGLQASGIETSGDIGLTRDEATQRELLGDVGSAAALGKSDVNKANLANVGKGVGNLLDTFKSSAQPSASSGLTAAQRLGFF